MQANKNRAGANADAVSNNSEGNSSLPSGTVVPTPESPCPVCGAIAGREVLHRMLATAIQAAETRVAYVDGEMTDRLGAWLFAQAETGEDVHQSVNATIAAGKAQAYRRQQSGGGVG